MDLVLFVINGWVRNFKDNWGLLYNLSESKIKGSKNFSCARDFACYVSFIEATILERHKNVLKDVPKIHKF